MAGGATGNPWVCEDVGGRGRFAGGKATAGGEEQVARRRRKRRASATLRLAASAPAGDPRTRPGPQAQTLLGDVVHLRRCAAAAGPPEAGAAFARAAIVMSAATIEAATNDALATIFELMVASAAPDQGRAPPWRYFRGRSSDRVDLLMRHGTWIKRLDYVVETLARTIALAPPAGLPEAIQQVMRLRNRIVHMNYLRERAEDGPPLSPADLAAQAAIAADTAAGTVDFLRGAFEAMHLPIAGETGQEAGAGKEAGEGKKPDAEAGQPARREGAAAVRRRRGRKAAGA